MQKILQYGEHKYVISSVENSPNMVLAKLKPNKHDDTQEVWATSTKPWVMDNIDDVFLQLIAKDGPRTAWMIFVTDMYPPLDQKTFFLLLHGDGIMYDKMHRNYLPNIKDSYNRMINNVFKSIGS
jgi:hypothetical protein